GSASRNMYVPAWSVAPGICTGPLKVRYVFLFHSSARAPGTRHAATIAVPHIVFTRRMSFPPLLLFHHAIPFVHVMYRIDRSHKARSVVEHDSVLPVRSH